MSDEALRLTFDLTAAVMSRAGTGRYPRELLPALQRRDDLDIMLTAASQRRPDRPLSRMLQGFYREGVYYPYLLSRRAARADADLVHTPAAFTPRVAGRPYVLTIHDVLPLRYPELFRRVVVAHSRFMWGSAARRAARVITGSEHTKRELVELLGLEPERVAVTPYGVSSRFSAREVDRQHLTKRFGITRRFVLCVGTLEPRKNLVGSLRAFREVARAVEDVDLVIVGGGGWRNQAFESELGSDRDRVRMTGHVSDGELEDLYAAADCFLFPSLYEGFGFPVLEAMASGTPVVTSDRTSIPEVVGNAGLALPPDDIAALADGLRRVLVDEVLASELREAGLARAAELTWDACAEATASVYATAVAEA